LLRGACHRARVRATRWLAMTGKITTICEKSKTHRSTHDHSIFGCTIEKNLHLSNYFAIVPVNPMQSAMTERAEIEVMPNLSRVPVIVAAIVSGICAFIGLLIFWHTYLNTPTVQEIPIYLPRRQLLRSESKAWHMLQPEIILIFFFLWMSCSVLTWKHLILRGIKIQEQYVRRFPIMSRLNMPLLLIAISSLICAFSALHLWDLISRSNDIWKLA
jgi:hypothetical protein